MLGSRRLLPAFDSVVDNLPKSHPLANLFYRQRVNPISQFIRVLILNIVIDTCTHPIDNLGDVTELPEGDIFGEEGDLFGLVALEMHALVKLGEVALR